MLPKKADSYPMPPQVLHIAVPIPLAQAFSYLPPKNVPLDACHTGSRIWIHFKNRRFVGFIVGHGTADPEAPYQLRHAGPIIDSTPLLPDTLWKTAHWAAQYYHHPWGDVLHQWIPSKLREGHPATAKTTLITACISSLKNALPLLGRAQKQKAVLEHVLTHGPQTEITLRRLGYATNIINGLENKGLIRRTHKPRWAPQLQDTKSLLAEPDISVNDEQAEAITRLNKTDHFHCFLLEGVTGSGKTEVYLHAIAHRLALKKQSLVLIPEINLTPQTLERFQHRFNVPVVAYHSQLSDTEKLTVWQQARSGYAAIIIGTRSATLLPLANPGLIVVDEEHDSSFKQQEGFRYHARDVAIYRAHQENIPILLGTATPSLESLHNALTGKYTHLRLRHRPTGHKPPQLHFIDVRGQQMQDGLSQVVIEACAEQLRANQQVLIFLNRRGYAPIILCHHCGKCLDCPQCSAHLTWHKQQNLLKCHHCQGQHAFPTACTQCNSTALKPIGQGTERIEHTLHRMFPDIPIHRVDRDTTQSKLAIDHLRHEVNRGDPMILVGTQMLAKGHHFPHVTLSVILNGDTGLLSIDFRGTERLAQLIIQVAGRAGRGSRAGQVLIQTLQPEHPVLQQLQQGGYPTFAMQALVERQQAAMPPFGHLALLRAEATDPTLVQTYLTQIKTHLCAQFDPLSTNTNWIEILGPVAAPMSRRAGFNRQQILLQTNSRKLLHQALRFLDHTVHQLTIPKHRVRWSLDVDPIDLY